MASLVEGLAKDAMPNILITGTPGELCSPSERDICDTLQARGNPSLRQRSVPELE